jgi:hypothetical protein
MSLRVAIRNGKARKQIEVGEDTGQERRSKRSRGNYTEERDSRGQGDLEKYSKKFMTRRNT